MVLAVTKQPMKKEKLSLSISEDLKLAAQRKVLENRKKHKSVSAVVEKLLVGWVSRI